MKIYLVDTNLIIPALSDAQYKKRLNTLFTKICQHGHNLNFVALCQGKKSNLFRYSQPTKMLIDTIFGRDNSYLISQSDVYIYPNIHIELGVRNIIAFYNRRINPDNPIEQADYSERVVFLSVESTKNQLLDVTGVRCPGEIQQKNAAQARQQFASFRHLTDGDIPDLLSLVTDQAPPPNIGTSAPHSKPRNKRTITPPKSIPPEYLDECNTLLQALEQEYHLSRQFSEPSLISELNRHTATSQKGFKQLDQANKDFLQKIYATDVEYESLERYELLIKLQIDTLATADKTNLEKAKREYHLRVKQLDSEFIKQYPESLRNVERRQGEITEAQREEHRSNYFQEYRKLLSAFYTFILDETSDFDQLLLEKRDALRKIQQRKLELKKEKSTAMVLTSHASASCNVPSDFSKGKPSRLTIILKIIFSLSR